MLIKVIFQLSYVKMWPDKKVKYGDKWPYLQNIAVNILLNWQMAATSLNHHLQNCFLKVMTWFFSNQYCIILKIYFW